MRLVLAVLTGVSLGQVALADYEDLTATPAAPLSTPETVPTPVSTAEAVDQPVSTPEAGAAPLTGPQVYRAVCIACHAAPGVGGAPPLGDRDAWAARIAQGKDTLIDHALHGFSGRTGVMPRKGDRPDLSDEEVIAAVEYMIGQVAE